MDTFDFVDHRRRPGRRGGRVQGPRARRLGRRSSTAAGSAAAARTSAACRPSRCSTAPRATPRTRRPTPGRAASARRDYMVNRPAGRGRARRLRATSRRSRRPARSSTAGSARIVGRGTVAVSHDGDDPRARRDERRRRRRLDLEDPAARGHRPTCPIWTNREATLARELPASLLVLGGGPTGCELAQVYARFGVPTTIVQSGPRLAPTDHPRNSDGDPGDAPERDGVDGADSASGPCARRPAAGPRRRARHRPRRRLDGARATRPARAVGRDVPARRPRPRALRHRHQRPDAVPARRPAAHRRRAVGDRRPGRPRAPHPPGPLPGRAGRPDGARRAGQARLPGAAARDLHGPRGGVGRRHPGRGARGRPRCLRARRRLRQDRQGLLGRGQRSGT